ncbi:hypothetical protein BLA24_00295 [Streptomyces cinnamoneus]|uniref:Uncharacterized protein n=1 Tax=Streptomyces cinnamoneus TaxID=53446 RepID=A0A2G1XQQ4_STRCJ|nr:hypothetical protein BLA24_00295 [Streptomyces cinnamoneus]
MDGVSTYLALTFGTLLSSQGTDASFVLTLSGFPPGASLRCFPTLPDPFSVPFPVWNSISGPRWRGLPDFIRLVWVTYPSRISIRFRETVSRCALAVPVAVEP